MNRRLLKMIVTSLSLCATSAAEDIRVLIVDGQNNHNWQATTPVLVGALEDTGLFQVDVATSPNRGKDMSGFQPTFSDYDVVVSNYSGDLWSAETRETFVQYVRSGGGVVIVHAANNSFPQWKEYNQIIGLGGWGGRNEASGPYVFYKDGQIIRDSSKGPGGSHGPQHEFVVVVRDDKHPITSGMPGSWIHAKDELYDSLRGPGTQMEILATAYSPKSKKHEPMMMTVKYGEGRIFHTPMGHADYSMQCAGFVTSLQRGAQWAASGKVSIAIPGDFPNANEVRIRAY